MGAEFVAFVGVEGGFEESAEDGGLDVAPVLEGGELEKDELLAIDGEDGVIGEKAAVKLEEFFAEDGGVAGAGVHFPEELLEHGLEAFGFDGFEEVGETAFGEEADIFGEHAEEAAAEEFGDFLRGVSGGFEGFGEFGEVAGDFGGDFGGFASGIEAEGIGPDESELVADFFVREISEADAGMARVGKWEIGFTGLRKVGVEFEGVADIDHDEEWRIFLSVGESANVTFGLAAGADHGVVVAIGAADGAGALFSEGDAAVFDGLGDGVEGLLFGLELFGFEDEAVSLVEIDATLGGVTGIAVVLDGEFEGVTVLESGFGARNAE